MAVVPNVDFAVVNATQLLVVGEGRGGPRRGVEQGDIDILAHGALVAREGTVIDVGTTSEILGAYDLSRADVVDATGKVVMPGLVDAHTHPLFAGLRYEEYAHRLGGLEMADASAEGGGIWWTVQQTRAAPGTLLSATLEGYLETILSSGTTTVEAKSGYGQNVESELQQLSLIADAARRTRMRVIPTFLGAHVVPAEHPDAESYADEIVEVMLPKVEAQGVARFCDTTCNSDFTPTLARRIMEAAARHGLPCRVHADGDADTDGWVTAVAAGARSADHLTSTPPSKIAEVGASDTVAVLIPAAELCYFWGKARARDFIRNGVPVAIATDFCSSIHGASLFRLLSFAAPWYRMTPEEVISAVTVNAAYSLDVLDRCGTLTAGKAADMLIVDVPDYRQMIYDFGAPLEVVVSGGARVAKDGAAGLASREMPCG